MEIVNTYNYSKNLEPIKRLAPEVSLIRVGIVATKVTKSKYELLDL